MPSLQERGFKALSPNTTSYWENSWKEKKIQTFLLLLMFFFFFWFPVFLLVIVFHQISGHGHNRTGNRYFVNKLVVVLVIVIFAPNFDSQLMSFICFSFLGSLKSLPMKWTAFALKKKKKYSLQIKKNKNLFFVFS